MLLSKSAQSFHIPALLCAKYVRHVKFDGSGFIGDGNFAFLLQIFFSLRTGHFSPNYYFHNSTLSLVLF